MELLPTQKDELFDLVSDAGFNPSDFQLEDRATGAIIKYRNNTSFSCDIFISEDPFRCRVILSPGEQRLKVTKGAKEWRDYKRIFKFWLNNLKRELNAEHKWNKLYEEFENSQEIEGSLSQQKFTDTEVGLIKEKFESIKKEINNKLELQQQEIKALEEKLDHLINMTEELNKTDWFELFIGSLFSWFWSFSLDPENVEAVWGIVKNTFGNFFLPN